MKMSFSKTFKFHKLICRGYKSELSTTLICFFSSPITQAAVLGGVYMDWANVKLYNM
ncbi:hypothetical protein BH09BAC5_BH09BAC5_16230 [soil metagenome]